MAETESSMFLEESALDTSTAPQAPREEETDWRYKIIVLLLLLLLLLLLGMVAFMPGASHDNDGNDDGETIKPVYAKGGSSKQAPLPITTSATTSTSKTAVSATTTTTTTSTSNTTTTPRPTSTGYGYLVCTFGRGGYSVSMLPIKQELCDLIVFTHVLMFNGSLYPATGNTSFQTFLTAATANKGDPHTRFGLSHSPHSLGTDLKTKTDATSLASSFLEQIKNISTEAGLSAFGVMGLVRKVNEFVQESKLGAWFKLVPWKTQEVASFAAKLKNVNGSIFLGIKLKDPGTDLATNPKLATDVFRMVKSMAVKLLVLVTHTAPETGALTCVSQPVSSWSSSVYKDSTTPALEPMFKFLTTGLAHEKELEVALSSTLTIVAFEMKQPVSDVQFGQHCTRSNAMAFEAACLPSRPRQQKHEASITAYSINGTIISSFETAETVGDKMRRFVIPLDDKVYRRVGWAFFDIAFEVHNKSACLDKKVVANDFPRLTAAKAVLDENRNRKFP